MPDHPDYLRHVKACTDWNPAEYLPLDIADTFVGLVRRDIARFLVDRRHLKAASGDRLGLAEGDTDFEARTVALDRIGDALVEGGLSQKRRRERYTVAEYWGAPAVATVDRGFVTQLGIRSTGVHLNGIVESPDGDPAKAKLWIGVRAKDKAIAPGKLDNMVAGGQPHGLSLMDNLAKECAEEADVPGALAGQARPAGAVTYTVAMPDGLRRDTLFVYDLVVPPDFIARNTDGELDDFHLWPIAEVMERLAATDDFKFNVNLVLLDLFIRRGLLTPDHPDYLPILAGIHS